MAIENVDSKIRNIASADVSPWFEKAKLRAATGTWLERSAQIALLVLRQIRQQGTTQKQLAEKMGVSPQQISKILQGSENLTLETIGKLESALEMELVKIAAGADYSDMQKGVLMTAAD